MRLVNCLPVVFLLAGCERASSPQTVAPPVVEVATSDDRLVNIERFDCAKPDDIEGGDVFPWTRGISRWSAGGPGGASWNASQLQCVVEFKSSCTQGDVDAELRVGGALLDAQRSKIKVSTVNRVSFILAADQWEKHLDEQSSMTGRFSYRTATFSVLVMASCVAPETLGPSDGPRLEFADDRHFSAGFAGGE